MKTLLLLTARGVRRFAIWTLLLFPLALIPARTEANTITLGEIELSGNFTVTPNNVSFSSFGDLTVIQASGIFTPLEHRDEALVMNTPFVLTQPSASNPIVWSIGGYTMNTTSILIAGAEIAGRNVLGLFDLSGHQFDHARQAHDARGFWDFTTPPFDSSISGSPVTGPVTLTIREVFDNGGHGVPESSPLLLSRGAFDSGHGVPEPSSLLLLGLGLAGLLGWQWKQRGRAFS